MRRPFTLLLAAAVLALGVTACASASQSSTSSARTSTTLSGPPPLLPQAVIDTVLDVVGRAGGATTTPVSARYAYGTRRQALRALGMGDLPPNQVDSKVFVVVADGSFALPDAKVRKGAPEPKGSHLVVVVDPDEPGDALDVAVSQSVPRLTAVGQVIETVLGPAAVTTSSVPGSPAPPS